MPVGGRSGRLHRVLWEPCPSGVREPARQAAGSLAGDRGSAVKSILFNVAATALRPVLAPRLQIDGGRQSLEAETSSIYPNDQCPDAPVPTLDVRLGNTF